MIIRFGRLIIGTEKRPFNSKLEITLHGNYWDKQLPLWGNKVIACHYCTLDIHGLDKSPLWVYLDKSAKAGDTEITLSS